MSNSPMCSGWKLHELHHVGLTVADLERSIAFYGGTLGMILLRRRPHVDHDYVALQTGYPAFIDAARQPIIARKT